jgi:hypothetical protein
VLYRGIADTQLDVSLYMPLGTVRWPSFSSASLSKPVAEGFMHNDANGTRKGLLFMLISRSARDISAFSRFPEEQEHMFQPNTEFTVKELHCSRWGASAMFQELASRGQWVQLPPEEAAKRDCLIIVLEECDPGLSR